LDLILSAKLYIIGCFVKKIPIFAENKKTNLFIILL